MGDYLERARAILWERRTHELPSAVGGAPALLEDAPAAEGHGIEHDWCQQSPGEGGGENFVTVGISGLVSQADFAEPPLRVPPELIIVDYQTYAIDYDVPDGDYTPRELQQASMAVMPGPALQYALRWPGGKTQPNEDAGARWVFGPPPEPGRPVSAPPSAVPATTHRATVETHGYQTPALVYITDAPQLEAVLPRLIAAPRLALDTETTGLDPHRDRLRLVQVSLPDAVYLIDVAHIPAAMLAPVFSVPKVWVIYNAKFDLEMLITAGLPVPAGELLDPMLMSQALYAGAPGGLRHRLEDVVPRELGIPVDKALQTSDWSGELSREQLGYAARDAAILWPIEATLMAKIEAVGLTRVAQIESGCVPALAEIELTGMPVNAEAWRALTREAEARMVHLTAQMAGLLNGYAHDLFGACTLKWGSTQQVLALLQARGHGITDTEATTLKLLGADDPLVPLLLDYRDAETLVSTFGDSWSTHVHPTTGRLHSHYFSMGSRAGRMTCEKPNIQQTPRDPRYRQAICAPEGSVLVKADYSQIELRLAAMLANDQTMLKAFRAGKDLHRVTGAAVMGLPESDVTAAHRQISKSLNFGLLYGMGARGLRA